MQKVRGGTLLPYDVRHPVRTGKKVRPASGFVGLTEPEAADDKVS